MILHAMYLLLLHQTGYKSALSCGASAYEHKWNATDAFIGLEVLNVAMAECSVATNHLLWEGGKEGEIRGKQGKTGGKRGSALLPCYYEVIWPLLLPIYTM